MSEWIVNVNEKPHAVTVERAPNGKWIVRVDRRIVAPPQPGEAIDCWFLVDVRQFHLFGAADALQLVATPEEEPEETQPPTDAHAAAEQSAEIVEYVKPRFVLFIAAGIVLFFAAFGIAIFEAITFSSQTVNAAPPSGVSDAQWKDIVANARALEVWIVACCVIEAALGAAIVAGAAWLMARRPWAPLFLEVATWSVPAVLLAAIVSGEPFAHDQMRLAGGHEAVLRWYSRYHQITATALVVSTVVSGLLLFALQRKRLESYQRLGW